MSGRELQRLLAGADPVDRERLARLDLVALEADLTADLEAGLAPLPEATPRRSRRRPARLALAAGAAALALVVALALVLAGGGSDRSSRAYGAELIRFAESTPLLLLEGPGWRVENVDEHKTRAGNQGTMEFITGKPIPYPVLTITGNLETGERVSGLQPAAVRQRKVELGWRTESFATALAYQRERSHPHGLHFVKVPVLGTTAVVDTRAEFYENQGGPNDREMTALWREGGDVLTLRAAVPDLAAMEERLGWVTKVDSQTWLEAMPAKVVKAADFEGTVRGMLHGIPTPKSFSLSRVPDEGLTTTRYQVGATVAGVVSCLWLRQWGEARRTGDAAAEAQAVQAMATAKHWPILREMAKEGGYPDTFWEVAAAMPRGYWIYRGHPQNLLAHAESLGCARLGLPLLPAKMKRQREGGVPPPPD